MNRQIVLGMGAGQCGTLLLAQILDKQHDAHVTHEQPPLLPWYRRPGAPGVRERLQRLLATSKARLLGDVASFYLPYAEEAIEFDCQVRIACLRRPRDEVVASFCTFLDQAAPFAINHWAQQAGPGWYHDPIWTRIFPQYDTPDREEGLRRYWDEYYGRAEELVRRFPDNVRVWDTETLTSDDGVREVLSFAGIPRDQQVILTGQRTAPPDPQAVPKPAHRGRYTHPLDPRKCVILVPFIGFIHQECEDALKELERRGYAVRRVGGYAAIDQGRNQLATDALLDGFEETLWIDSDIGFHPDSVDRLRSHAQPLVCGVYPQKGKRALACHIAPGTPAMVFGRHGGLVEILYAGAGFLLVRREVYLTIQHRLRLPVCNERFGHPTIPFFLPMLRPIDDGYWYLAEDYAFCQRALECGYKIYADTSIRLWHIGNYRYGWEDAGLDRQRFGAFTLNFGPAPGLPQATATERPPALANFAAQYPWPERPPEVAPPDPGEGLPPAMRELLARTVPPNVNLILNLNCGVGQVTRGLVALAPRATVIAVDTWPAESATGEDGDATFPSRLRFDAFLGCCWDVRDRIIPVRTTDTDETLQQVAEAGLQPEVVYLSALGSVEAAQRQLTRALDLFPEVIVMGADADRNEVRQALENIARDRGIRCDGFGPAWRILPQRPT